MIWVFAPVGVATWLFNWSFTEAGIWSIVGLLCLLMKAIEPRIFAKK